MAFGAMGAYMDDCSGGATIFGNVFYKMSRATFIGGGRDNRIENNVYVECDVDFTMVTYGGGNDAEYANGAGQGTVFTRNDRRVSITFD